MISENIKGDTEHNSRIAARVNVALVAAMIDDMCKEKIYLRVKNIKNADIRHSKKYYK